MVYKPDIQQGNIVNQDMVDQLRPGMSKRQARFVMGTPMLTDVFHGDRWDYVYSLRKGDGEMTSKRLALYFQGDSLARIEGDLQPQPDGGIKAEQKETVVSVPDYDGSDGGIFTRLWDGGKQVWEGVLPGQAHETPTKEQAPAPESSSKETASPPTSP